jgi:phosphoribosylanthranilate isomerase
MGHRFFSGKRPVKKIVVQIYEVQTPSEAEKLIDLGVDHIGSVITSRESWKSSVIWDTVNTIHGAGKKSSLIPLFDDLDTILFMLDYYGPDIVHFCEAVTTYQKDRDEICGRLLSLQKNIKNRFPEINIMRSIPIPRPGMTEVLNTLDLARVFEPVSDYFLTDTLLLEKYGSVPDHQPVKGFVGITGKICDWEIAGELVKSCKVPVILAGGITPDNVFDGIMKVQPTGVDSCTGTNALDSKGRSIRFKKDIDKVKRLVDEVRRVEQVLSELK